MMLSLCYVSVRYYNCDNSLHQTIRRQILQYRPKNLNHFDFDVLAKTIFFLILLSISITFYMLNLAQFIWGKLKINLNFLPFLDTETMRMTVYYCNCLPFTTIKQKYNFFNTLKRGVEFVKLLDRIELFPLSKGQFFSKLSCCSNF